MSSMQERFFCDCYLKFISLVICLDAQKQRRDFNVQVSQRHLKHQNTSPAFLGRHHQDRPHTTPAQSSHLEKQRTHMALSFQMCPYQLCTFLNMWKQREDHKSGKLEGRKKKIPSGKDLKLILKNVQVENACWSSIKVKPTIEGFCSDVWGLC